MASSAKPRIDVHAVRAALTDLHSCLRSLVSEVDEEHRKLNVCGGYAEFQKAQAGAYLTSAGKRLEKKEYTVALAGPFKAGKSTFLSALLQQPGMLPAEDQECTFSVCVISTPPPGQPEHVRVSYHGPEAVLRIMLDHKTYFKLYEKDLKARDAVTKDFAIDKALSYFTEVAAKHATGENQVEAAQLKDFVESFQKNRDRLGREINDDLSNLPRYVRKETGIGHLLLVKMVEIFRNNPVIAQHSMRIADTPGTDSLNRAARDMTLKYLESADAVIYMSEAKGLTDNFDKIREVLVTFNNTIREKMFIVANKADQYDIKSMRRDGAPKASIEGLFENIVGPLRALGINETRVYFLCGRVSELAQKAATGQMTADERTRLDELKGSLDERRKALDPNLNPVLREALSNAYTDGGVERFRSTLREYLEYDIQAERLKEIYIDLKQAFAAVQKLLAPDQARVEDLRRRMGSKGQQITEFFEKARAQFEEKVGVLGTGASRAVGMLSEKAREQVEGLVTQAADRLPMDRVRSRLRVPSPLNVKTEVINYFKMEFSAKFSEIVRDTLSPAFRAKLGELSAESRLGDVLTHLAKGYGADFDARFRALMDGFSMQLDQFTLLRSREETWDLLDTDMKPASFEVEWTPQVEADFRADLKAVFVERFNEAAGKLKTILARHYAGMITDLTADLTRLLEDVAGALKRDPDRVPLPTQLLTGGAAESEEELRQRCLLSFFRQFADAQKPYGQAAAAFPEVG